MEIEDIIPLIKERKELRSVSDNFLYKLVKDELRKRAYLEEKIKNANSLKELKKDEDFIYFLKEIRKKLHDIYGIFAPKNIKKIWEIINSNISFEKKVIEVLKLSKPTKERLNFYKDIYSFIFLEKPENIMDIASGLNPISIYFSKDKPKEYYFVDISPDIIIINEYFLEEMKIKPIGYEIDIFEPSKEIFEHYQYIFIWKTIPIIEKYYPRYTENFLKRLNFDFLIISFPRKSISGKRELGRAWKYWIKRIFNKIGYKTIKEFRTPNELFMIVR